MGQTQALKLAIDLLHFPAKAQSLKVAPLPDGVIDVVRIAAGEEEAMADAVKATGRSQDTLREAAGFFVEQVLLHPGADSYRVLGMMPDATHAELRQSMALLQKWLHPDRDVYSERSVFASRVADAWNNLKTDERRAAYDQSRHRSRSKVSAMNRSRETKTGFQPKRRRNAQRPGTYRQGPPPFRAYERDNLFRRILMLLFGRAAP